MPQDRKNNDEASKKDTTRPRNESTPGQLEVGTTSKEQINAENSPEVRDALNESQL